MPASSRASRARDAREIDSLTRKVATLEAQLKARGGDIGDSATGSPAEGLEPGRYSGLAPTDTPDESQQAGNDGVLIDTIGSLAIAGEDRTVRFPSADLPLQQVAEVLMIRQTEVSWSGPRQSVYQRGK